MISYEDQLKLSENDTGSPEFQVGRLTDRIDRVARHVRRNKKDNVSRLNLMSLVWKRRRLIGFLERVYPKSYQNVLKVLQIDR